MTAPGPCPNCGAHQWHPIETAQLGKWILAWAPTWRRPFPAMRNGDNGAVWIDTCEEEARGWQGYATRWMPLPEPPKEEA